MIDMKLNFNIFNIKKYLGKKYRIHQIAVIIFVLIAGYFLFKNREETEILVVRKGEFLQQVAVSGTVVPIQEVSIAVSQGGPVAFVPVKVGDTVKKGQQLISVNTASLRASLLSAKADVALKQAEIKNKGVNIERITKEQDTMVKNAYVTMLSDDLTAVPIYDHGNLTPPSITGRYSGDEGTYEVIIYRQSASSDDYLLRTYGLEESGPIKILKYNEPTPLGSHGLFISFPDGLGDYKDTNWKVTIPNTKSASYITNYNNYVKAADTSKRTIAEAKENLEETSGTSILKAQLQKAEAEVQKILADIEQRIIRAPFDGLVTKVNVKVGETASSNQVAVEMMSSGNFQIESYVPEIYVPLVKVANEAQVVLDAYGPEKPFSANVIAIDPAKTIKDGLPTYKTTLQIKDENNEVKSGMTANVVITTERKENVISIPQGTVKNKNAKKFVNVQEKERITKREAQTGAVSYLGLVEIISGLQEFINVKEGEKITEREVQTGSVSSLGQIEIISGLQDGDIVIVK